jgi:hypothetical protein
MLQDRQVEDVHVWFVFGSAGGRVAAAKWDNDTRIGGGAMSSKQHGSTVAMISASIVLCSSSATFAWNEPANINLAVASNFYGVPDTQVGPVTTPPQYQKILDYIAIGKNEGAQPL